MVFLRQYAFAIVFATASFSSHYHANACVSVSTSLNQYKVTEVDVWSVYTGAIDYVVNNSKTAGISEYPPARQIREWTAVMATPYSVMAMSDPLALEFFGRESVSRFFRICPPENDAEKILVGKSELESFTYAYLWSLRHYVPVWATAVNEYALSIGADLSRCPSSTSFDCGTNTPVGFAKLMYDQVETVFDRDGWNANGDLTAANNVLAYEDWRTINWNNNDQYIKDCTDIWQPLYNENCGEVSSGINPFESAPVNPSICWTPIQRNLNWGTYRQQYLYPHVAETGRSYFLGNKEICDMKLSYPCYDYFKDRQNLLLLVGALDDEKKAEIEFFQNVWSWFMLFQRGLWDTDTQSSQFQKIRGVTGVISSMYEATIVTWKEKMRFGFQRPRTDINLNLEGNSVFSYLGPNEATSGSLNGEDWIPYVFEEATAEYPSHIACVCYTFTRAMRLFTGAVGLTPPITHLVPIGSSQIETGHPFKNYTWSFDNWDEMADTCVTSRKNAGSLFEKAVIDTESFCSNIADLVTNAFDDLNKGTVPDYVINVDASGTESETRGC